MTDGTSLELILSGPLETKNLYSTRQNAKINTQVEQGCWEISTMAIQFRCAGCDGLIQIGDDLGGKQVRCPMCQLVQTVPDDAPIEAAPASSPQTDSPERRGDIAEAIAEQRLPALSVPPPLPPQSVSTRASQPEERPRRRTRDREREDSSVGLVVGLCVGGGLLLVLLLGGVAWLMLSEHPDPGPWAGPPDNFVGKAEDLKIIAEAPPWDLPREELLKDIAPFIENREMRDNLEKVKGNLPPIKVGLNGGVFETEVRFEPNARVQRFEFDAKADTVYWIATKDNFRINVRVEGPGLPLPKKELFGGFGQEKPELAFLAAKPGPHSVFLEADAFELKPCRLTIREMDGTTPLPNRLKIKTGEVDLPRLAHVKALDGFDRELSGAAFAPDNKSFFLAHSDLALSYWEHPDNVQKGVFKTNKDRLFALGVDKHGRLYAQAEQVEHGAISMMERKVADILVWEKLKPTLDKDLLPAPSKVITLRGIVQAFINSHDGRWLYFLDVHNRKLGRIDTAKATIEKEIDTLSPGVKAFCLTPDGKKIYCCSSANKVDVIDAVAFKLIQTVRLDRGKPIDIAATNQGFVFMVGDEQIPDNDVHFGGTWSFMIDLSPFALKGRGVGGEGLEAKIMPLPVAHGTTCVALLPDQRAVLFSGDRRVTPCSIPARPALFEAAMRDGNLGSDRFSRGRIVLSPDGRTLVHDSGLILSVSR